MIKALLDAGANPETKDMGSAPLSYWAAMDNGNPEVIQALLDAGVSQDTKDKGLDGAASNNVNPEVTQVLLDADANPDAETGCKSVVVQRLCPC